MSSSANPGRREDGGTRQAGDEDHHAVYDSDRDAA
jgi:hypothetical protein